MTIFQINKNTREIQFYKENLQGSFYFFNTSRTILERSNLIFNHKNNLTSASIDKEYAYSDGHGMNPDLHSRSIHMDNPSRFKDDPFHDHQNMHTLYQWMHLLDLDYSSLSNELLNL